MKFCEFELANGKHILFNVDRIDVVIEHGIVAGRTILQCGGDSWELGTSYNTVIALIRLALH